MTRGIILGLVAVFATACSSPSSLAGPDIPPVNPHSVTAAVDFRGATHEMSVIVDSIGNILRADVVRLRSRRPAFGREYSPLAGSRVVALKESHQQLAKQVADMTGNLVVRFYEAAPTSPPAADAPSAPRGSARIVSAFSALTEVEEAEMAIDAAINDLMLEQEYFMLESEEDTWEGMRAGLAASSEDCTLEGAGSVGAAVAPDCTGKRSWYNLGKSALVFAGAVAVAGVLTVGVPAVGSTALAYTTFYVALGGKTALGLGEIAFAGWAAINFKNDLEACKRGEVV